MQTISLRCSFVLIVCLAYFQVVDAANCNGSPCSTCQIASYSGGLCNSAGCGSNPCYATGGGGNTPDKCGYVDYTCNTNYVYRAYTLDQCSFNCSGNSWIRVGPSCPTGDLCLACTPHCMQCTSSASCSLCDADSDYDAPSARCRQQCSGDPAATAGISNRANPGTICATSGVAWGSSCSMLCNSGFTPSGSFLCSNDSSSNFKWVAVGSPSCTATTCTTNPASGIANIGTPTLSPAASCNYGTGVASGQICTLNCAGGYTSGGGTYTCSGGSWTPSGSLTCNAASCTTNPAGGIANIGTPTLSPTGSCNYGTGVTSGQTCNLNCASGYSSGGGTYTCSAGSWTPSGTLTCTASPCTTNPAGSVLHTNSPTLVGATCNYVSGVASGTTGCQLSCASGYTSNGGTYSCSLGSWSSTGSPACNASPCTTNPAGGIANIGGPLTLVGSQCNYGTGVASGTNNCQLNCASGYTTNGGTYSCSLGSWSSTGSPACNPSPCTTNPASGVTNTNTPSLVGAPCNYGTGVASGTTGCQLSCASGYTSNGGTYSCSLGSWSSTGSPACNPSACGAAPTPPTWATLDSGCNFPWSHGKVCTFTCNAYSTFNPSNTITCQYGSWSNTNTCQDINECSVSNGGCDVGTTCINLPGQAPSCGDNPCAQSPSPGAAATFQPGGVAHGPGDAACDPAGSPISSGSTCALTCLNTYTASGGFVCGRSVWVTQSNTGCTPKPCSSSPLGSVANSQGLTDNGCTIGNVASGTDCSVTCQSGYAWNGFKFHCYATAWSNTGTSAPACVANPCISGDPTTGVAHSAGISGAGCAASSTGSGVSCNLVCQPGYTARGGFQCNAASWSAFGSPLCSPNPCTTSPVSSVVNANAMLYCNPINSASGTSGCALNCSAGWIGSGNWTCLAAVWTGGPTCLDVNECATSNGGCPDNCDNAPGTFSCSSPSGSNAGAAAGGAIGAILGVGAVAGGVYIGLRYKRKKELEINEKRMALDSVETDAPIRPWQSGTVSAPSGSGSAAAAFGTTGGGIAMAATPVKSGPGRNPVSVAELLTSPKATAAFEKFLASEYSSENLLFYRAVEQYRATKHNLESSHDYTPIEISRELRPETDRIHNEYFGRDIGSKNVNVPTDVAQRLDNFVQQYNNTGKAAQYVPRDSDMSMGMSTMPKKTLTVFDEAQETVYSLMESDSLPRFLKSDVWTRAKASGAMNDAGEQPATTTTTSSTMSKPTTTATPSTKVAATKPANAGPLIVNPSFTNSTYQAFTAVAPAPTPTPEPPKPTPAPPALPAKSSPPAVPPKINPTPTPPVLPTPPVTAAPTPVSKPFVPVPPPPAPVEETPKPVPAAPTAPAAPAAPSVSNPPRTARAGSGSVPVPPPPAPPAAEEAPKPPPTPATVAVTNPPRTARAGSGSTPVPPPPSSPGIARAGSGTASSTVPPPPPAPTTSAAPSPRVARAGSGSTPVPVPPPPAPVDAKPAAPAAPSVTNPPRTARAGSGSTPVPPPPAPSSAPTPKAQPAPPAPAPVSSTPKAQPAPPAPATPKADTAPATSPRSFSPPKAGASSINAATTNTPTKPSAASTESKATPPPASPKPSTTAPTAPKPAGALPSTASPPSPVRQFSAPRPAGAAAAAGGAGSLNKAGSSSNLNKPAGAPGAPGSPRQQAI